MFSPGTKGPPYIFHPLLPRLSPHLNCLRRPTASTSTSPPHRRAAVLRRASSGRPLRWSPSPARLYAARRPRSPSPARLDADVDAAPLHRAGDSLPNTAAADQCPRARRRRKEWRRRRSPPLFFFIVLFIYIFCIISLLYMYICM